MWHGRPLKKAKNGVHLNLGGHHRLNRWHQEDVLLGRLRFWYDVNANVPNLGLGFGDYGTLSPEWTEEILERRSNRIAIRYTRGVDWLILRADGKTTNDSIAISEILVNTYPKDFKGAPYSFGDQILSDRADPTVPVKKKRCGHYHITEGWSHHIAYVLKEQY
ncbi:beta family protein [Pseudomonas viridiflava]|uniref:beta family protein n=1 Tax=Pseudomonas viridiflava TaxID=33069 RepID=UPI001F1331B6|nr:beta family protein [Pseudomonas viridiflava]